MEWVTLPLRRYFDFSGRSRRREYWTFVVTYFVLGIVTSMIDDLIGRVTGMTGLAGREGGPVGSITTLLLLIPGLAVAVRRLHDTGRSGWWLIAPVAPVLVWIALLPLDLDAHRPLRFVAWGTFGGAVALLVFLCREGTRGANRYGADPKGGDLAEIFR